MADDKNAGTEKKSGSNKLLLIIVIVLVAAVAGLGGALLSGGAATQPQEVEEDEDFEEEEYDEEDEDEEDNSPQVFEKLKLDPFVVNLGSGSRYLRTTLILEYDQKFYDKVERKEAKRLEKLAAKLAKKAAKEAGNEETPEEKKGVTTDAAVSSLPGIFGRRYPMLQDQVISFLSSKKASEMLSPDGKITLKKELVGVINKALASDEQLVLNIYFADFIIQ